MLRGVVVAVLGLLATLGVSWAAELDKETIGAIVTVLVFVVPLVQAWWTRRAVTSNRKIVSRVTTAGEVVAGDASVLPTGTQLETPVREGWADVAPGVAVGGAFPVAAAPVDPQLIR